MKQKLAIAAAIALFALTGCSAPTSSTAEPAPAETTETTETTEAAPAAPLDLTGEWKQTNFNDESSFQSALISADKISIDWVNEDDGSTAIYWVGTYVAPTEAADSFTWDSENDKSITDTAIMASGDDTKTFTYKDGVLSYELTALGTTMTVEMEQQ